MDNSKRKTCSSYVKLFAFAVVCFVIVFYWRIILLVLTYGSNMIHHNLKQKKKILPPHPLTEKWDPAAGTQEALRQVYIHYPDYSTPYNLKRQGPIDHSQFSEGQYITDFFFPNKTHGFFLEAGAFDGERDSYSLQLEINHKWTGLLVEPNPFLFSELKAKNRKALLLQGCISNPCGIETMVMQGMEEQGYMVAEEAVNWLFSWIGFRAECFRMTDILKAIDVTHIDWMILDLEGSERDALESFPWDSVTVDLIQLEVYVSNKQEMVNIEQVIFYHDFLTARGYEEQTSTFIDVIYRRKSSNIPRTTAGGRFGHAYNQQLINTSGSSFAPLSLIPELKWHERMALIEDGRDGSTVE
eukprot:GHVQ01034568.1.p1 GENE.GHVQ01034568.1~~GHVQ01034568.1.p1  ORF type:complete len:356 (+),score=41.81 GHVQ01034568.1:120-1187(+)